MRDEKRGMRDEKRGVRDEEGLRAAADSIL